MYVSYKYEDVVNNVLNENLSKITTWSKQWLVTFSEKKPKSMTMSFKKTNSSQLEFNDVKLSEVDEYKHLGLTFSSNLSWTTHVNELISSVSKMSDVLKRLKYDLDRKNIR